jgi:hypothetical protein
LLLLLLLLVVFDVAFTLTHTKKKFFVDMHLKIIGMMQEEKKTSFLIGNRGSSATAAAVVEVTMTLKTRHFIIR